ncbi:MAG: DUF2249 domain-containing protein [Limisphaerales bacterium]
MVQNIVTLDVREDLRAGREPFGKIMSAVAGLKPTEQLQLVAPFEPVPLFHLLARRGFSHTARALASGDWEVLFTRASQPSGTQLPDTRPACPQAPTHGLGREFVEVDARGLEPPQPLVRILETLVDLPEGAVLKARTDRRPMHLYAQLEERGYRAETKEESDGSFATQISR